MSSYTNPRELEPPDHAIGRSRGGLTSKVHLVSDGRGRPLNLIVTPANVNDTTMLGGVIDGIRVPRTGPGRPRTRPDNVLADKGYPSRANRSYLAARGIRATIPDREDQKANRKRKGSAGGRPPALDTELYRKRNVVERCFNRLKNWRGIATRTDKTARNYRAGILLASTLIWIQTDLINTP
jgi:transposase